MAVRAASWEIASMKRFYDLPLAWKILIPPALTLVALLVVAAIAMGESRKQEVAVGRLDAVVFERLRTALEIKDAMTLFVARLHGLMSAATTESDKKRIDSYAADLMGQIARTGEALARFSEGAGDSGALQTKLAGINEAFAAFRSAAVQVIDTAKLDAAYGAMLMGTAEEQFRAVRTKLDDLGSALQMERVGIVAGMTQASAASRLEFSVAIAIAALLSLLLAALVARLISRPVVRLTSAMGQLAKGDTSVDVPDQLPRDEIGAMARALSIFKDAIIAKAALETEKQGENTRRLARQTEVEARILSFGDTVQTSLDRLAQAAATMKHTSVGMVSTAERTNQQSAGASDASEQVSRSVQATASATEQLAASISEVGRQVNHSASIASRAAEEASRTNVTVQSFRDASQKIGEVVGLINSIASQTNLLALNATIEAARAGDAGRGFAVVASEVKSLAGQTAKATEEIAGQVAAIQEVTVQAVDAIQSIGLTITEMNEIARAVAATVQEQAAAAQEITRGTQQAAIGTTTLSGSIADVSQGAGETGHAAVEVVTSAGAVGDQAALLRAEISGFLAGMAA
jgi:methyl-accepting chemotaxis protein